MIWYGFIHKLQQYYRCIANPNSNCELSVRAIPKYWIMIVLNFSYHQQIHVASQRWLIIPNFILTIDTTMVIKFLQSVMKDMSLVELNYEFVRIMANGLEVKLRVQVRWIHLSCICLYWCIFCKAALISKEISPESTSIQFESRLFFIVVQLRIVVILEL